MPSCRKCGHSFPNRMLINGKIRMLNKRKFCLSCSPFDQNNRKDLTRYCDGRKVCPGCGIPKSEDEFYRKGTCLSHYCKSCSKQYAVDHLRALKRQCIQYKGGHCVKCGYNRCPTALEFHHLDAEKKELNINKAHTSFEKLKPELDKCILVCANCHREIHAGIIDC